MNDLVAGGNELAIIFAASLAAFEDTVKKWFDKMAKL